MSNDARFYGRHRRIWKYKRLMYPTLDVSKRDTGTTHNEFQRKCNGDVESSPFVLFDSRDDRGQAACSPGVTILGKEPPRRGEGRPPAAALPCPLSSVCRLCRPLFPVPPLSSSQRARLHTRPAREEGWMPNVCISGERRGGRGGGGRGRRRG